MKNLSDKNKRWLIITGLGVVCIALVIAISSQLKTKVSVDGAGVPSSTVVNEVNPNIDNTGTEVKPSSDSTNEKGVAVQQVEPTTTPAETPSTAVSAGTKQTIQPDPIKPTAPKETPKPQGETTKPSKAPTYKPEDTTVTKPAEPKGGEKKDGKVYLPGFGWVTETGGSGTTAGDMYENGNKIGNMN